MSNEPHSPPTDGAQAGHGGRRGVMLVLSSPSGAGKSTIARELLNKDDNLDLSVSVTTRTRRPSEVDGSHYHFITPRKFEAMRVHGELLECAEVHGNFYGTPREPVHEALAAGRDMLFDIDYQGARQLREAARDDVVCVFILPPSMEELRARLERRAEDAPATIDQRLKAARLEIAQWPEYDYIIVNEDLENALAGVRSILAAERLRRTRYVGLDAFADQLIGRAPTA